ncbi:DUF695 domain-containing protein [Xinfangfangia sp. CPCC 101601]|uniref:DUF695 domain-containing protein n=1 Tax=Pseudogemmobacter lacusdianii TaxID=3069608 RepID=A0ABU0W111_9RHOB|nr:DUF695 domain-containing protein [Xinfangfangia sp. CPCC 101601]MDQ2067667.1 DUF695 domain-containing protein [Xinfangfangia sp. CPCC 101601]
MTEEYPARPEPFWVNYVTLLEERPALISVDAGWMSALGFGDAETLLGIEIPFHAKGDGEIVSRDELPVLQEIAEAIEAELPEEFAHLVARRYGAGKMVLYVYAAHPDDIAAIVSELLEDSDYEPRSFELQDPEWAHYRDVLCPDDIVWQNISNDDLRAQMAGHGDNPALMRRIDHVALFPDRDGAGDYAARVEEIGFEVEAFSDKDDPDFPIAVEFWRDDAPDGLNEVTGLLVEMAREYVGRYDGWGARVVAG